MDLQEIIDTSNRIHECMGFIFGTSPTDSLSTQGGKRHLIELIIDGTRNYQYNGQVSHNSNTVVYDLKQEAVTIGRDIDNRLVLNEDGVSEFHAAIYLNRGKIMLIDIARKGTTYIDEFRLAKDVELCDSGRIDINNIPIRYRILRE